MIITANENGDLVIRNTGFHVKQLLNLMKNTSDKEILEGYNYLTQEDINAVRFMNVNEFSIQKPIRLYSSEDMRVAYEVNKTVPFSQWIRAYEKGDVIVESVVEEVVEVIEKPVDPPTAQNLPKDSKPVETEEGKPTSKKPAAKKAEKKK